MDSFNFSVINPISTEIFLAGVAPPPQPFVLKLHDSNFVQNYFGGTINILEQKSESN